MNIQCQKMNRVLSNQEMDDDGVYNNRLFLLEYLDVRCYLLEYLETPLQ